MCQPWSLESYLFLFKLLLFSGQRIILALYRAWAAESEQMSGPKWDEFDMFYFSLTSGATQEYAKSP